MTVGSYVLARFNDPEKLLPAMQAVQSCGLVMRWSAVDGHVQLVLKVATPSNALPEQIKRLPGVDQLFTYDILLDREQAKAIDPALAHAYIFLEVEAARLDSIRAALSAMPEMVFCTTTRGGCDLVALLSGATFDDIDHTIHEKCLQLDGLLRLKHNYVLELTKL